MTTSYEAIEWSQRWHDFWRGGIGEWILTRGLKITLLIIFAVLAARFISWTAQKITRRIDADFQQTDQLVRTETAKHRQAVASVISWVSIAVLFVVVAVDITDVLAIPVGSLVAPAAVLGAALGFGAQRIVQDLLAGFFVITEKQYGFGDLVALTVAGIAAPAEGTVEDVTLRVTRLRSTEGEVFTIPNGQIVKTMNLSKDWARAVIDIPVPTSADLTKVDDLLHSVSEKAMQDESLRKLLLDAPQVMGVESIEVDTVNLRMVARTLPGKQFEVGRRIRVLVVEGLIREGIVTSAEAAPVVNTIPSPASVKPPADQQNAQDLSRVSGIGSLADAPTVAGRATSSTGGSGRRRPPWWWRSSWSPGCTTPTGRHHRRLPRPRPPRWCRRASCPTRSTPGCPAPTSRRGQGRPTAPRPRRPPPAPPRPKRRTPQARPRPPARRPADRRQRRP
jgi:small conductance mechanosensitive channel